VYAQCSSSFFQDYHLRVVSNLSKQKHSALPRTVVLAHGGDDRYVMELIVFAYFMVATAQNTVYRDRQNGRAICGTTFTETEETTERRCWGNFV